MIPRTHRFPMRTDFLKFRATAKRTHTPHLTLYHSPSPTSLFAVVIPKKFNGSAVIRNHAKRLLKRALYPNFKDIPASILIIAKPVKTTRDELGEVLAELESVLPKIKKLYV